jgi:terminal uridylyltransferase
MRHYKHPWLTLHPFALRCRSPSSDIDLCLQVPPSDTFTKEYGVEAMANLATKFTEAGLTDVDTVRLTARIPIVKFNVPYKEDGEEIQVECDLSLQNPLACLNTSLLHTYSKISQTTCVLAAIIKRWAKNRNINNPSQHTLSSYGYVILLIHFLTSCDFNKNGYVLDKASEPSPILPNLQLVDPSWARNPTSGSYREITAKPNNKDTIMQHPTEPNYYVNSYFYSSELEGLQKFCSENHNDFSSLGALLASFFHYYAYDFDYKKHVISLNRMHSSPLMEREIKAEEDGWSLFGQGLAIEDPFEQFYDVAHVVKASNFSHMLREFSLAYTKIVNAAFVDGELPTGRQIIDMICEPVSDNQKIAES